MFMAVGVATHALSYLQSLLAPGAADAGIAGNPLSSLLGDLTGTGSNTNTSSTPSNGNAAGTWSFDPGTMAALISLQDQSANGAQGPTSLFAKLDTDGDGQISQSDFETVLGKAGVDQSSADALFAKLDANGDGQISPSELQQARHGGGHHHHHMHAGGTPGGGSSGAANALLSAADASGATTQTTTNADGSSTTTITYADGSKVEMTTPATASNDSGSSGTGGSTPNTANLIERLIQMQAQLLNQSTSSISTVA